MVTPWLPNYCDLRILSRACSIFITLIAYPLISAHCNFHMAFGGAPAPGDGINCIGHSVGKKKCFPITEPFQIF